MKDSEGKKSTFSKNNRSQAAVSPQRYAHKSVGLSHLKKNGGLSVNTVIKNQITVEPNSPVIRTDKIFESQAVNEPSSPRIALSQANQVQSHLLIFDSFVNNKATRFEGTCFLKTRTDRFKDH